MHLQVHFKAMLRFLSICFANYFRLRNFRYNGIDRLHKEGSCFDN
jgi:hypothetical protein